MNAAASRHSRGVLQERERKRERERERERERSAVPCIDEDTTSVI